MELKALELTDNTSKLHHERQRLHSERKTGRLRPNAISPYNWFCITLDLADTVGDVGRRVDGAANLRIVCVTHRWENRSGIKRQITYGEDDVLDEDV